MDKAFSAIPQVDTSALFDTDQAAIGKVAAGLKVAASEVGFLHVTGHDLTFALYDTMLAQAERLFATPLEEKMQVYIGLSRNHRDMPRMVKIFSGSARRIQKRPMI